MTVDEASEFLADVAAAARSLTTLQEVGLGYLRLGQPATELSGGEAQRIKLASELQRPRRGHTLYVLDEPTTGLHPADVDLLDLQLHRLVDAGNTVVVAEHDMRMVAGADWVIDLGPGAGNDGGRVVAAGPPDEGRTRETQPHGAVSGKALGAVRYSMKKLSSLMNDSRRSSPQFTELSQPLEVGLTHNLVANVGAVEHRVAGHRPSQHRSDSRTICWINRP